MLSITSSLQRFFACVVWSALLVASSVSAQSAWRFDMGSGAVASDALGSYVGVVAGTTYPTTISPIPTFGWLDNNGAVDGDADVARAIAHVQPNALLRDHVKRPGDPLTFGINVSPGAYHVTVYLGDVSAPVADMKITANSRVVAQGIFARTVHEKASFQGALGGFKRVCFKFDAPAQVPQNTPRLRLTFEGPAGQGCPVMGIEIRPYTQEPLYFDDASKQLASNVSPSIELATGISEFNSHQYDDAIDSFRSAGANHPSEKLAMCYGFAFVLGSLTEHMHAVDYDLLDEMLQELSLLNASDSAVHNLLVEAKDFQLGELFDRTRGYTIEAFPDNPMNLVTIAPSGVPTWITLNLCAAVQLLEQMHDDILAPTTSAYQTESPLFPKARYLIARNMWGRNTLVSAGNSNFSGALATCDLAFVDYNKYWVGIIENELWPNLSGSSPLYPMAHEATAFCFLLQRYLSVDQLDALANEACKKSLEGGLFAKWANDPERPASGVPIQQTWWAPYSKIPNSGAAGGEDWAQHLRAHTRQFRNLARWWIEERLLPNDVSGIPEFGGGSGDDQELTFLSAPWIGRSESADNPNVEQPLNSVWDAYLFREPQVSVEEGYFAESGDVEHSAEFTSNLLFVLMPTAYGDPDYLGFGVRTMRNMEDLHMQDPTLTRWTQADSASPHARHFRSFSIGGSAGPDLSAPNQHDMPINMKAIVPGLSVAAYNGSTELRRLFEEHAWAWSAAAMSSASGKPEGFFPGSVEMSSSGPTGAFGTALGWWTSPAGYSDFPGYYAADIYMNQVVASRHQASQQDRVALLEPLAHAVIFVADELGGAPSSAGSNPWVAFKARTPVANAAWFGKSDLFTHHPWFDEPNIQAEQENRDRVNYVISSFAAPTPKFLNQSTSGPTAKGEFAETFRLARLWLEEYWPLATTTVNHVDRLIASIPAHNALMSTPSGGIYGLAPTYAVNWFNPNSNATTTPSEELDCAVLVNRITPTSLEVLLYNAKSQPQAIGMRAWRFLEFGEYTVKIGPNRPGLDQWLGTPMNLPNFEFDASGKPYVFDLPSGMHLLRFSDPQPVTTTTPAFDLAVGRHSLAWEDNTPPLNDRLHVRVVNLASTSFDASTWTARVRVAINGGTPAEHDLIPTLNGIDNSVPPLTPQTFDITPFDLGTGVDKNTQVTVDIWFSGQQPTQISTDNDTITVRLGDLDKL